jgi:ABC-2 type transport system permease protein
MGASSADRVTFKRFHAPKTVVARFVARRTLKSAVVWAFIFGVYAASKTIGYAKAYPTAADKVSFAHSLGADTGMAALLGTPHNLGTVSGYANWNTLGLLMIIGSVWALLLATKYFRGEEESGRSELLLTGQTTARRAAANTLLGLSADLVLLYAIVAVLFIGIGKYKDVGYGTQNALFFALAVTSAAAVFLAVGAFTSQLMPTRSRSSTIAAGIFGISFVLRAIADTTSEHWLLNVTPLGWIEKLQPLVGSQPIWLLPIFGLVGILYVLTVWIAGRRDLGDSVFADHDTAVPRTGLLGTPFTAAIRLTRAMSIGWLLAITASAYLYGSITKSVVQTLNGQGEGLHKALAKVESAHKVDLATIFLGVVFLVLMAVIMAYVASAIGKVREDEAEGYVDNFLVEPVGRWRWLGGRVGLITFISLVICLCASLGVWAGEASVHTGVPIHTLLEAGANMIAPVLFTLGVGVFALGIMPRRTTLAAYCVLGWSFLITLIAGGTNLSHWILDTSILHQTALAPAVNPNWTVNIVMIGLALVLCFVGMFVFNARDLETE